MLLFPAYDDRDLNRSQLSPTCIRRWSRSLLIGCVLFAAAFLSRFAMADQPSVSAGGGAGRASSTARAERSALEESLVKEALEYFSWQEELRPEGKLIEEIEFYVAEVFDDRDPIPKFVNAFHTTTRHWVLRQELLQDEGDPWDEGRITETERNLRVLRQLSMANLVAARGSTSRSIRLLVVVKDVWSLRLNSDWDYGSSGLDMLLLNPTEENIGGIRASLGGYFLLERHRYFAGGSFTYPRLFGSGFALGISAGVINHRFNGNAEGGYGSFSFRLPQYTRRSRWAFGTQSNWLFETTRRYQGGQIEVREIEDATGQVEAVPFVFETERLAASYYGVRSWGIQNKFDLQFGLDFDRRHYRAPQNDHLAKEVLAAFEDQVLPVNDQRYSPYLRASAYQTNFHRVVDVETIGLQEDFRRGYHLSSMVFAGSESLGSTRNLIGTDVSVGYTLPIYSGLVRAGVASRIVVANEGRNEAFASARARFVSPRMPWARLHIDGYLGHRFYNYLNVPGFRLGGDNRLRGYVPGAVVGDSLFVSNAELRTTGINILSAQVGLAFFYDLGGANTDFKKLKLYQSAGGGVRILFPQLERTVMRLDWGVPLIAGATATPGAFFFTFGQAFPMPSPSGGGSPFN